MKTDVPATSARRADMISAILMAIAICPSWPHACITPFVPEVNGLEPGHVEAGARGGVDGLGGQHELSPFPTRTLYTEPPASTL